MGGTAVPGRCGKERNLPGSAVECPGMRWACVTEPATRYSCARGWHSSDDTDGMSVAWAVMSGFEDLFVPSINIESNGRH